MTVAFPLAAFWLAPSAHADSSTGSGSTPGANLAGINTTGYASGIQISPLTPGLVGAGDVGQGNLVEAAIPYATTSTSTGPSNSAIASPAYPGDTASQIGNLMATFASQVPTSVQNLLNYPAVARADYPAQVSVGTSSKYSPPGGSTTGALSASANAGPAGATGQATTNNLAFAAALVSVDSSTASSSTQIGASSAEVSAQTDVSTVKLLGTAIVISGISSRASASSNGTIGQETSDFSISSVTVAGVPASIGPDGITLKSSSTLGVLVSDANQVLVALKQAGISVHTIAPVTTEDGAAASVTSGGLVIAFQDSNVPNPGGNVPVSSLGLDLNLGITEASANATALPAITPIPVPPLSSGLTPSVTPSISGTSSVGSSTGPSTQIATSGSSPGASSTGPSLATGSSAPSQTQPSTIPPATPAATVLGAPVKVAWMVIAFLLSLVASGPLLGYANWQLLRGRKS
jgi:hypothetical protein